MQYMVVEYMEIKQLRKGSKATALVIHSRTQAELVRPYRARSGGSNGVLYVFMRFTVVEVVATEKGGYKSEVAISGIVFE